MIARERLLAAGELAQPIRDIAKDARAGRVKFFRELAGPLKCLVDDHPPVDHEEEASRCRELLVRREAIGLGCQGINRDVDTGRFARCSGQSDCPWPRRIGVVQDPLSESPLPSKRWLVPERFKETREALGFKSGIAFRSLRHRPT